MRSEPSQRERNCNIANSLEDLMDLIIQPSPTRAFTRALPVSRRCDFEAPGERVKRFRNNKTILKKSWANDVDINPSLSTCAQS